MANAFIPPEFVQPGSVPDKQLSIFKDLQTFPVRNLKGRLFYVATGLERVDDQRTIVNALTDAGHQVTYDWAAHGSVQATPGIWASVAKSEAEGVAGADYVIVLLPGGYGTHVELGLALGAHRRVIIVGDQLTNGRTCIFYHHPAIRRVVGVEDGRPWSHVVAEILGLMS